MSLHLSGLEQEATRWHSALQNSQIDFRTLHQNLVPALLAIGVERPDLIQPSVTILCSSNYIGSLDANLAKVSTIGLDALVRSVPDIASYVKAEKMDYLVAILETREKISDESWRQFNITIKSTLLYLGTKRASTLPRKPKFYPPGTPFDVYSELRKIAAKAKMELIILDPYFDEDAVALLGVVPNGVVVKILAVDQENKKRQDLVLAVKKFEQQYGNVELRLEAPPSKQHSRFIILDTDEIVEITSSINKAGDKTVSLVTWTDAVQKKKIFTNFTEAWEKAQPVIN